VSTAEGGGGGETVPNDIDSTDYAVVEATVETAVDLIGEATSELDLQIGPVLEKNDPCLRIRLQSCRILPLLSQEERREQFVPEGGFRIFPSRGPKCGGRFQRPPGPQQIPSQERVQFGSSTSVQ